MPFPQQFCGSGGRVNRNRNIQRGFGLSLATLALVVACTDATQRPAITDPSAPTGPNLAAAVPFNNEGACLASDAYVSGLQPDTRAGTPGVNDPLDLADPESHCT